MLLHYDILAPDNKMLDWGNATCLKYNKPKAQNLDPQDPCKLRHCGYFYF